MTTLLDEACGWVRAGSVAPPEAAVLDPALVEEARLMAEAFAGDAGRARLMILARLTVLRPPVDHRLPAGQYEAYAQMRQGQDSIFAAIVRFIDLHAEHQRSPQHGPQRTDPDAGTDPRFAADPADGRSDPWDPAGLVAGR